MFLTIDCLTQDHVMAPLAFILYDLFHGRYALVTGM